MNSRIEVDLRAMARNLGLVRRVISVADGAQGSEVDVPSTGRRPVRLCAVLKQDGYGCGGPRLAKHLAHRSSAPEDQPGADMIAVYSLDEARSMVEAAVTAPILVLMPVRSIERSDPVYRHAADGRLHLTLHDEDQLRSLGALASRLGVRFPVHLHVDTGMSRGGCSIEDARRLVATVSETTHRRTVRLAGLMTHFTNPCHGAASTADQARLFKGFLASVAETIGSGAGVLPGEQVDVHAANTCATFRSGGYHGTMVRIGQALLGYSGAEPRADAAAVARDGPFEFGAAARELEPAIRWSCPVVHVQEINPGWPVGYGSQWRAPTRADGRKTRVALLPVGYADGYPRSLGEGEGGRPLAKVGLTGRRWERPGGADRAEPPKEGVCFAPVVGRVSMDQITVDVTDMPESAWSVGAEAEIYGRSHAAPNYLPVLAAAAGTITHELLCRMDPRIERVYRFPQEADEKPIRVNKRGEPLATAAP